MECAPHRTATATLRTVLLKLHQIPGRARGLSALREGHAVRAERRETNLAAVARGARVRTLIAVTRIVLVDVLRRGLVQPLERGLQIEAEGFARCKSTVDMDVGMKNFIQNGPRVPAAFFHE